MRAIGYATSAAASNAALFKISSKVNNNYRTFKMAQGKSRIKWSVDSRFRYSPPLKGMDIERRKYIDPNDERPIPPQPQQEVKIKREFKFGELELERKNGYFNCPYCEKSFASFRLIESHLKKIHFTTTIPSSKSIFNDLMISFLEAKAYELNTNIDNLQIAIRLNDWGTELEFKLLSNYEILKEINLEKITYRKNIEITKSIFISSNKYNELIYPLLYNAMVEYQKGHDLKQVIIMRFYPDAQYMYMLYSGTDFVAYISFNKFFKKLSKKINELCP